MNIPVRLQPGTDPQIPYLSDGSLDEDALRHCFPDTWKREQEGLSGDKVGGFPHYIQAAAYPDERPDWRLLLQFDGEIEGATVVNFGTGTGYVFISSDGHRGGLLWQTD